MPRRAVLDADMSLAVARTRARRVRQCVPLNTDVLLPAFVMLSVGCTTVSSFYAVAPAFAVRTGLRAGPVAGAHACRRTCMPALRMTHGEERLTRRDGLKYLLGAPAAAFLSARAVGAESTAAALAAPEMSKEMVFCDQAVSHLLNVETGQNVYIVGTAHISSVSAALVRDTIRFVKPDKVMVELDSQRVKKRRPSNAAGAASSAVADEAPPPTSFWGLLSSEWSKPVSLGEKLANVEAGVIGLAISSLYKKLDKMGFSSGQEFITAIREAEASGATLILGDRPVDMTLKRLQQSIEKTGFDDVMAFASGRAGSPEEKLLASKLEAKSTDEIDAAQLASTVEILKERGNVRKIMASLQTSLPEVYEALIAERDRYMATSILKASGQMTVAVVGMAHMDGIERTLGNSGFTFAAPTVACTTRADS